ncbi:hypothetical protein [Actinokineospora enzanensis]|nr:hypothetical protein [Actinokineospora enzanensis]
MGDIDTATLTIPTQRVSVDVIGGRAPGWPSGGAAEDEDYEPTIVRGRE